jgi:DNA polymerase III subunit epsilon
MLLFFDTETTGLPLSWQAPQDDLDNWPRLVQLAWILADESGNEIDNKNRIVKPENFIIPESASRVHGITTEHAAKKGITLKRALTEFKKAIESAKTVVAHNISFDEKIVGAEFLRKNVETGFFDLPKVCTMQESTNFCKIENGHGYKWPKLMELHQILFDEDFAGAHDAMADVRACARCFFELRRRGVM